MILATFFYSFILETEFLVVGITHLSSTIIVFFFFFLSANIIVINLIIILNI